MNFKEKDSDSSVNQLLSIANYDLELTDGEVFDTNSILNDKLNILFDFKNKMSNQIILVNQIKLMFEIDVRSIIRNSTSNLSNFKLSSFEKKNEIDDIYDIDSSIEMGIKIRKKDAKLINMKPITKPESYQILNEISSNFQKKVHLAWIKKKKKTYNISNFESSCFDQLNSKNAQHSALKIDQIDINLDPSIEMTVKPQMNNRKIKSQ